MKPSLSINYIKLHLALNIIPKVEESVASCIKQVLIVNLTQRNCSMFMDPVRYVKKFLFPQYPGLKYSNRFYRFDLTSKQDDDLFSESFPIFFKIGIIFTLCYEILEKNVWPFLF